MGICVAALLVGYFFGAATPALVFRTVVESWAAGAFVVGAELPLFVSDAGRAITTGTYLAVAIPGR